MAPPPVDEETLAGHPPVPWPGADGFEDIFYDGQDPNRKRLAGPPPGAPHASLIRQIAWPTVHGLTGRDREVGDDARRGAR